jgi:hypothetical protein
LHRWGRRYHYQRGDLAGGDEGAVVGLCHSSVAGMRSLLPVKKRGARLLARVGGVAAARRTGERGGRRHRVTNPPTVLLHAHGAPNLLLQKKWIIQREKGEEEKNGDEEMRGRSLALHGASARRPSVRGRWRQRGEGGKGVEREGVATMGVPSVAARVLLNLGLSDLRGSGTRLREVSIAQRPTHARESIVERSQIGQAVTHLLILNAQRSRGIYDTAHGTLYEMAESS